MDNPWQLCRIIGPLLSQRFPLASAKAQPRGNLSHCTNISVCHAKNLVLCKYQTYMASFFLGTLKVTSPKSCSLISSTMQEFTDKSVYTLHQRPTLMILQYSLILVEHQVSFLFCLLPLSCIHYQF